VHGLVITVLGMGLVFLTLGAIYLLMKLLVRLIPPKNVPATAPVPVAAPVSAPAPKDLESEKIAAISVALARALADESRILAATGHKASDRASGWVAAGRTRQLNHPQSREKRS
jgi:sodium pump decarboxylase gamma subunit